MNQALRKLRAVGICAVLTFFLILSGGIATAIVFTAIEELGFRADNSPQAPRVISIVATQTGLFCLGYGYARWDGRLPKEASTQTNGIDRTTVLGFSVTAVSAATLATLNASSVVSGPHLWHNAESTYLLFAIGLAKLCIAPPIEEFVFRGIIQGRLRRDISESSAIILGAVLFSIPHYTHNGNIRIAVVGLSTIFVAGLAFGWLYEKRGSLLTPIFAHSFFNAIIFIKDIQMFL